jgi:hypothetical protein
MLVQALHRQTILAINELLAAQRRFTLRRLPRILRGAKCIIQLRRFEGFEALENAMKLGFWSHAPRCVAFCGCAKNDAPRDATRVPQRHGAQSDPPILL